MKYLKYIVITVLVLGFMFSMAYYIKTNSRSAITYDTEKDVLSLINFIADFVKIAKTFEILH